MTTDFEADVCSFQEFLRGNGSPEKIIWIQPEDILLTGKRLFYLKTPVPESRGSAARQAYEAGLRRGLGVLFLTICELENATCCYVWTPENEEEAAQALMPVGLKMSIKADKISAIPVPSHLLWLLLRFRYRRRQANKGFLFQ